MDGLKDHQPSNQKLLNFYKRVMGRTNILSSNGATGANFLTILGLIGQGDHVIARNPAYVSTITWIGQKH